MYSSSRPPVSRYLLTSKSKLPKWMFNARSAVSPGTVGIRPTRDPEMCDLMMSSCHHAVEGSRSTCIYVLVFEGSHYNGTADTDSSKTAYDMLDGGWSSSPARMVYVVWCPVLFFFMHDLVWDDLGTEYWQTSPQLALEIDWLKPIEYWIFLSGACEGRTSHVASLCHTIAIHYFTEITSSPHHSSPSSLCCLNQLNPFYLPWRSSRERLLCSSSALCSRRLPGVCVCVVLWHVAHMHNTAVQSIWKVLTCK